MNKKIWAIVAIFLLVGSGSFLGVGVGMAWVQKGFASAETASWVQAFGSIGAILAAVLIMNLQYQRQQRGQRRQYLDRQINFALAGFNFADRLQRALIGTKDLIDPRQLDEMAVSFQASNFAALSRTIDGIPSWEAGAEIALHFSAVQRICHGAAAVFQGMERAGHQRVEFRDSIDIWIAVSGHSKEELSKLKAKYESEVVRRSD